MFKRSVLSILLLLAAVSVTVAQTDSADRVSPETRPYVRNYRTDSAFLARRQFLRDSVKRVQDSLAVMWVKAPDPNRPNRFLDSLLEAYTIKNFNFKAWAAKFPHKVSRFDEGRPVPKGDLWVVGVILFLVLLFAVIRYFFTKELSSIVQSFYSNQVLSQINKEDNLFSSWPFVFLYLLFGLVIGMFLYLSGKYLQISYPLEGFELFIGFSAIVVILFTAKIIVLRLLGFLFDVRRLVREYVSILYLSYFNSALLFLPLIVAFSLTSGRYAGVYGYLGLIGMGIIFFVQFLRAGANILSNYRFPKVYLIIYLCALEFCPLIILFKSLRY